MLTPVKPIVIRRRPRPVALSVRSDWQSGMQTTGHFVGLFALFWSTTNWWFFKRTREEAEKKNKSK